MSEVRQISSVIRHEQKVRVQLAGVSMFERRSMWGERKREIRMKIRTKTRQGRLTMLGMACLGLLMLLVASGSHKGGPLL